MHYTFDAFRICSIRCWGKERMQHFMNAVIMHQNGGYNNAGAFRRSCIIIHFVELHLLYTAFTKIWCAFSYVLHSAALRCSSRFTLDALRTLPISGSTADLPLPFSGPSSSLILTGSAHSHLFTLAENPFGSPSLSPQRDDDSLRCRALCLHRRRDDPGSKAHRHQPVYSRELRHHD